jgi:hypothetical protein
MVKSFTICLYAKRFSKLSDMHFLYLLPLHSWKTAIFLRSVRWPPTEPLTVTHARGHWWTLHFANAFVSPGVNSRGELVPSHGASRRRLGDKDCLITTTAYSQYIATIEMYLEIQC